MVVTKRKERNTWQYRFGYQGKMYKKTGFKTRREALKKEDEAKELLRKGNVIDDETSFLTYYYNWIEVNKKGVITRRAFDTYGNAINQFKSFLNTENMEDIKLNNLSLTLYRKFIKWYGSNHTTESVRKVHNCLKASIEDAIQEGLIHKDPTYKAFVKGNVPTMSEELKYMRVKDFKALKEYVKGVPIKSYFYIYLIVLTGARFGEIQKITRSHFLFDENKIHIEGTKTETSDRIVSIHPEDMLEIKKMLLKIQSDQDGYIFNNGNNFISHNAVQKTLTKFCREHEIKRYTLHAIRHTHCSFLLHENVSIYYISKRLGHKSIKTTMDVYSHLLDETQQKEDKKAVNVLNF